MPKKLLKQSQKNTKIKVLLFLAKFFLISIPIIFIINLNWYGPEKIITDIVSSLLTNSNVENVVFDTINQDGMTVPAMYIVSKNLILRIDWACTGIRSAYFLFALLFSAPLNLKKQFKYLLIGVVIISLVNILRIYSATFIAASFGTNEIFDNLVWSLSLNITAIIVFYAYAKNYFLKY